MSKKRTVTILTVTHVSPMCAGNREVRELTLAFASREEALDAARLHLESETDEQATINIRTLEVIARV